MENVIDIRPIKKQMRADAKSRRASMEAALKEAYDKKICNKLLNLWAVRECGTFLCYVSTPIEVDTLAFINALLSAGKRVAVPKCVDGRPEMNFYYIDSLEDLSSGTFGVLEPEATPERLLRETEGTICIVPAFMFDKNGFRLGYGKGYYDRYLSRYKGITIGICYDENIKDELFHGKYDRAVDFVLSEKRILTIDKKEV